MKRFKEKKIDFEALKQYIKDSSESSGVYIGGDSKTFKHDGERYCAYCISVIVHKDSKHGGKGFYHEIIERDYGDIKAPRARLMNEVYKVVDVANELVEYIGDRKFEIHLDINASEKYKSNTAMNEACGLVKGVFGVEPKIKPEAWAASTISDKYAVRTAKSSKNTVKKKKATNRENRTSAKRK